MQLHCTFVQKVLFLVLQLQLLLLVRISQRLIDLSVVLPLACDHLLQPEANDFSPLGGGNMVIC